MKKLLLLILLTLNINAEDIKVPNEICSKHFDKIIEHGWNEENATLNAFIIKSATHAIPKTLSNLRTPLIYIDDPKNPNYPSPKILINRDAYKQLFAYVKYLEHENRMEEVNTMYIDALKGLKNMKSKGNIDLIFRMVIESIILKSIKERQKRYGLNQELKNELKKSLLTNNSFLLDSLKAENAFFTSIIKPFPTIRKKNQELYNILISSIKNNSFGKYKSYKKEKRKELRTFGNTIKYTFLRAKEKIYELLNLEVETLEIDKFILLNDIYMPRPRVLKTYQEYLDKVVKNKNFLHDIIK